MNRAAGTRATIACLAWTLATGLVLAAKSAEPRIGVLTAPMEIVQPLHAAGAMTMLVAGVATLTGIACRRSGRPAVMLERSVTPIVACLLILGGVAIALGQGSGLEYMTWPRALSALPVALVGLVGWSAWTRVSELCAISAEGTWLVVMGAALTLLGLIERLIGSEVVEPTRALMVEWHAMDTAFAGINTSLYGLGVLCAAPVGGGRGLRSRWLFVVAIVALLSTFGHHHYGSGQPDTLKWIALGASMLGMVSFVRHLALVGRSVRARGLGGAAGALERAAGAWTLFAVGTGVVLAIPSVNHALHGTHAIVAHSMGSIIGVNVSIILGAMLSVAGQDRSPRTHRMTLHMQGALALVVLDLAIAGVCKGVLRAEGTYQEYLPVVRGVLTPLAAFGVWLAWSLWGISWAAWVKGADRAGEGKDALAAGLPACVEPKR